MHAYAECAGTGNGDSYPSAQGDLGRGGGAADNPKTINRISMNIDLQQKRELALKKLKASKERKKAYILELEKSMRQEYR